MTFLQFSKALSVLKGLSSPTWQQHACRSLIINEYRSWFELNKNTSIPVWLPSIQMWCFYPVVRTMRFHKWKRRSLVTWVYMFLSIPYFTCTDNFFTIRKDSPAVGVFSHMNVNSGFWIWSFLTEACSEMFTATIGFIWNDFRIYRTVPQSLLLSAFYANFSMIVWQINGHHCLIKEHSILNTQCDFHVVFWGFFWIALWHIIFTLFFNFLFHEWNYAKCIISDQPQCWKIHKSNYVDIRHLLVERKRLKDFFQFVIYELHLYQFITIATLSVITLVNNYFHIQFSKGLGRVSCQLVHINEKTNCLWSMAGVHSQLSDIILICTVIILVEAAYSHERIFYTL